MCNNKRVSGGNLNARKARLIESGFVTGAEAAKYLGCSRRRVDQLREAGVLSHAKNGGRYVYPIEALKQYAAASLKLGSIA